ncbi:MAG: stage II sporulation protein R [Clostridia bacterium]|nr:stage II sporulation protein R [Clostridia bacterium]
MKTITKAIVSGFIVSILCSFLGFFGRCDSISGKVFRLHIIANSDSAEDQSLKLKVRDRILSDLGENFSSAADIIEAEQLTEENLDKIESIAQDEILKNGYNCRVKVQIVHMYFNTRYYGDITLPAGYYDALRIVIGEGKGKNWWCVMFPPMCLPAAEGSSELEKVLDSGEANILDSGEKYLLEFKAVELYSEVQEFIRKFMYEPFKEIFSEIDFPYETHLTIFEFLQK